MSERNDRRAFLTFAGAGALLVACKKEKRPAPEPAAPTATGSTTTTSGEPPHKESGEEEVPATEDLMREHGVVRRVLVVYREAAARMRAKPGSVPSEPLQKAAKLFRSFVEDYHERDLEERRIFPVLTKSGGPLVALVETLNMQHQRGREITDYVLAVTQRAIAPQAGEPFARTLESFARMYEAHANIEDTVAFQAWRKALSPKQRDEMGELFEDIEYKTFGKNGYEDAVERIAAVEKSLGIDLAGLTAPPPPKT